MIDVLLSCRMIGEALRPTSLCKPPYGQFTEVFFETLLYMYVHVHVHTCMYMYMYIQVHVQTDTINTFRAIIITLL